MRHSGIESSTRSTLCAMQPQAAFQEAKKPKYAASERPPTGHKTGRSREAPRNQIRKTQSRARRSALRASIHTPPGGAFAA